MTACKHYFTLRPLKMSFLQKKKTYDEKKAITVNFFKLNTKHLILDTNFFLL